MRGLSIGKEREREREGERERGREGDKARICVIDRVRDAEGDSNLRERARVNNHGVRYRNLPYFSPQYG